MEHGAVYNRSSNIYDNVVGTYNEPFIVWSLQGQVHGLLHSHYNSLNNVPSPDDIVFMAQLFLTGNARDSNNLFIGVTNSSGPPIIVKVNNVAKFRQFAQSIVGADGMDGVKAKIFIKEYNDKLSNFDMVQNKVEFLKMIKRKAGYTGMAMFQAENNQCNSWRKLSIKSTLPGEAEDYEADSPCPLL